MSSAGSVKPVPFGCRMNSSPFCFCKRVPVISMSGKVRLSFSPGSIVIFAVPIRVCAAKSNESERSKLLAFACVARAGDGKRVANAKMASTKTEERKLKYSGMEFSWKIVVRCWVVMAVGTLKVISKNVLARNHIKIVGKI